MATAISLYINRERHPPLGICPGRGPHGFAGCCHCNSRLPPLRGRIAPELRNPHAASLLQSPQVSAGCHPAVRFVASSPFRTGQKWMIRRSDIGTRRRQ